MDPRQQIAAVAGPILKRHGFKKRALTWHLVNAETVFVVNFQRSQWSACYFLNLGVYFRDLGAATAPPEAECHMRTRVERLLGSELELSRALSFDDAEQMPAAERARCIHQLLTGFSLPWLERRSTKALAAIAFADDPHGAPWTTSAAAQLLARH